MGVHLLALIYLLVQMQPPVFVRSTLFLTIGFLVFSVLLLGREIRDHRDAEASSHIDMEKLANFATDLYWETNLEGKVVATGGRMMSLFSEGPNDLIGRHYLEIVQLDKAETFKMLTALQGLQPYSDILSTFHGKNGRRYHISLSATPKLNQNNEVCGYIGIGTNVTDRVRSQSRLQHLAEHDMLTGLANRYAFGQQIERDIRACTPTQQLALLTIDLDGFKAVNDKYGHQAGDALLRNVAKRLKAATREQDWAARLGGDEFVMVSCGLTNPIDACRVAARLTDLLSKPYRIGGLSLTVKASIGIACAPIHAKDSLRLMKYADQALYQAKADGKGCYYLYEEATLTQT